MKRWFSTTFVLAALIAGPVCADDKKEGGFVPLFNGKDLTGWKLHSNPSGAIKKVIPIEKDGVLVGYDGELRDGKVVHLWRVEDGVLIGSGPPSHLFSERGDYADFDYRIEAQINDGGNSGQYFRTPFEGGFPPGYEAQINATHRDPIRTGCLYPDGRVGLKKHEKTITPIRGQSRHKPAEWFTQEVTAKGAQVTIKVNGETTLDFTLPEGFLTKGHFALQGHDPGTEVRFRQIEVREIK